MWNEYSNAFYRSVYMFTLKANNTNQTGTRLMAFAFASLALALALLAALAHASLNCKDMMSVIFSIPRSVRMVQCSSQFGTPRKINVELRTWKWWFGRWFSFSRHVFSGSMFISGVQGIIVKKWSELHQLCFNLTNWPWYLTPWHHLSKHPMRTIRILMRAGNQAVQKIAFKPLFC